MLPQHRKKRKKKIEKKELKKEKEEKIQDETAELNSILLFLTREATYSTYNMKTSFEADEYQINIFKYTKFLGTLQALFTSQKSSLIGTFIANRTSKNFKDEELYASIQLSKALDAIAVNPWSDDETKKDIFSYAMPKISSFLYLCTEKEKLDPDIDRDITARLLQMNVPCEQLLGGAVLRSCHKNSEEIQPLETIINFFTDNGRQKELSNAISFKAEDEPLLTDIVLDLLCCKIHEDFSKICTKFKNNVKVYQLLAQHGGTTEKGNILHRITEIITANQAPELIFLESTIELYKDKEHALKVLMEEKHDGDTPLEIANSIKEAYTELAPHKKTKNASIAMIGKIDKVIGIFDQVTKLPNALE